MLLYCVIIVIYLLYISYLSLAIRKGTRGESMKTSMAPLLVAYF